jgi:hypothetical protein
MNLRLKTICKLTILFILPWQLFSCQGSFSAEDQNEKNGTENSISFIDSVAVQEHDEVPFLRRPSMFEMLNDSVACLVVNSDMPTLYNIFTGNIIATLDTSRFTTASFFDSCVSYVLPNIDTSEYQYLTYDSAMYHLNMAGLPNFQAYSDMWINRNEQELAFFCSITTPHFISSLSDSGSYLLMQQHRFICKTDFQLNITEVRNVTEIVNNMLGNAPFVFPAFGFALVGQHLFSGVDCLKPNPSLEDKFIARFRFTKTGIDLDSLITATDNDPEIYYNNPDDWERYFKLYKNELYCSNGRTIIHLSEQKQIFEATTSNPTEKINSFNWSSDNEHIYFTLLNKIVKDEKQTFRVLKYDFSSKKQTHLTTLNARYELPAFIGNQLIVFRTGEAHNYFDRYEL